jgi:hypothetical protein
MHVSPPSVLYVGKRGRQGDDGRIMENDRRILDEDAIG